jgi:hypothetical protein
MGGLEQTLANILRLIEQARIAGDEALLAGLIRRCEVICAMLGAPEQAWG